VYVTDCDLEKSFGFNKTAQITGHTCFTIHMQTYEYVLYFLRYKVKNGYKQLHGHSRSSENGRLHTISYTFSIVTCLYIVPFWKYCHLLVRIQRSRDPEHTPYGVIYQTIMHIQVLATINLNTKFQMMKPKSSKMGHVTSQSPSIES